MLLIRICLLLQITSLWTVVYRFKRFYFCSWSLLKHIFFISGKSIIIRNLSTYWHLQYFQNLKQNVNEERYVRKVTKSYTHASKLNSFLVIDILTLTISYVIRLNILFYWNHTKIFTIQKELLKVWRSNFTFSSGCH